MCWRRAVARAADAWVVAMTVRCRFYSGQTSHSGTCLWSRAWVHQLRAEISEELPPMVDATSSTMSTVTYATSCRPRCLRYHLNRQFQTIDSALLFLLRSEDLSAYCKLLKCFVVVSDNAPLLSSFYPDCRSSQHEVESDGGSDIWGLYGSWHKLKGDPSMCSEAHLKQVPAPWASSVPCQVRRIIFWLL
ncbi:uncharacterized protein LOC131334115 [Rhododendron vialii]|uniref:uncharacterized protein LOC131334115 n=1 Tax=Rhododendron vialii TaxID=182163 RepID=UPI00265DB0EB|nr:uncharacterized protein LOC131334115 [Rhododendron vialii]